MKPQQVLKVTVQPDGLGYSEEEFFSRMSKDGRIGKSKLILKLQQGENDEESLAGSVWKVELEPAEGVS